MQELPSLLLVIMMFIYNGNELLFSYTNYNLKRFLNAAYESVLSQMGGCFPTLSRYTNIITTNMCDEDDICMVFLGFALLLLFVRKISLCNLTPKSLLPWQAMWKIRRLTNDLKSRKPSSYYKYETGRSSLRK